MYPSVFPVNSRYCGCLRLTAINCFSLMGKIILYVSFHVQLWATQIGSVYFCTFYGHHNSFHFLHFLLCAPGKRAAIKVQRLTLIQKSAGSAPSTNRRVYCDWLDRLGASFPALWKCPWTRHWATNYSGGVAPLPALHSDLCEEEEGVFCMRAGESGCPPTLLTCPWTRHWIPISSRGAALLPTLCSAVPVCIQEGYTERHIEVTERIIFLRKL